MTMVLAHKVLSVCCLKAICPPPRLCKSSHFDHALTHHVRLSSCVAQLVDEAYQRWLDEEEGVVDDITAVLVQFEHKS
jgi:hypothetical protein